METEEFESVLGSDANEPAFQHRARLLPEAKHRQTRVRSIEERRERQILDLRRRAFKYTVVSSSAMLVVILVITLLQGFRLWGFDLPKEILYALLVATIEKVAESLGVKVAGSGK